MSRMRKKSKRKIDEEKLDQEDHISSKTKKVTYKYVPIWQKILLHLNCVLSGKTPNCPQAGDTMTMAAEPPSSETRRGLGSPRGAGRWPTCTRWAGSPRRPSTTSGTGYWTRDGSTTRTYRPAGCTNFTTTRSRFESLFSLYLV